MAEIGSGTGSDFPTQLDVDNTKEVDYPASNKTVQRADVPNDLASAVIAIETKVGKDNSDDEDSLDYKVGSILIHGEIKIWGGAIADIPSGYLLCDGAAVSRTTYADLFSAIGTIHGEGDGSTTFNIPDLRDKFIAGAKQDDGGKPKTNVTGSLTQSGGDVNHNHGGSTGSVGAETHERGTESYHDYFMRTHAHSISSDDHIPPYYAMVYMIKT